MPDEVQNLIMQVVNKDKIEVLNRVLEDEQKAIKSLNVDLQAGIITQRQYEAATRVHGTTALAATKQIDALKASTRDLGQATLTASHAFQDFVQGGVGGVLNNIPGLVAQLGGSAGLAGIIAGVGVAAFVAKPIVEELWKSLTEGSEAIPAATDALEHLAESLKASKDRVKEMKDSWGGTAAEVVEYNAAIAETARLEKALDEAQKQRKETEAARGQKSDDQAALARDFGKISGGADYDAIVANVAKSKQDQYDALRAEYDALKATILGGKGLKGDEAGRLRDLAARVNAAARGGVGGTGPDRGVGQVQEAVNKARQGDVGAFDELLKSATGDLRDKLRGVDPREAGSRAFNKKAAESQIADAIADAVGPLASAMRERNQRIRDVRETDRDMQAMADKVVPAMRAERNRRDQAVEPFRAAAFREGVEKDVQAAERLMGGGFAGEEGEVLARANMTAAKAGRGAASLSDVQKALADNEQVMADLELDGGFGSAAYEAFVRTSAQLRELAGQMMQLQQMQQQFRMQQNQGPIVGQFSALPIYHAPQY